MSASGAGDSGQCLISLRRTDDGENRGRLFSPFPLQGRESESDIQGTQGGAAHPHSPMSDPITPWRMLLHPTTQALRQAIAAGEADTVAGLMRLKRLHGDELVHVAIELIAARRAAAGRIPDLAPALVADREGVQQASSQPAARYKARRMAQAQAAGAGRAAIDLCCGIGADARAMAEAGLRPLLIDRNPLRAWMAQQNTSRPAACADAVSVDPAGRLVHIDPSRRAGHRRLWRLEYYRPGPALLASLFARAALCVARLGPGVDVAAALELAPGGELEIISESGRLTQAVLWSAPLARSSAAATLLQSAAPHQQGNGPVQPAPLTILGTPGEPPPLSDMQPFVARADPAVERAGLLAQLCRELDLTMPHPDTGLLTAPRPVASPWLTWFELLETMPWRPRRIRAWLSAHDGGPVEILTRGGVVDPDALQRSLRGRGGTTYTVFILRFDRQVRALITRRTV